MSTGWPVKILEAVVFALAVSAFFGCSMLYQEPDASNLHPLFEPLPAYISGYWYYCPASKTYYPYVKSCEEPWQAVQPTHSQS